MARSINHEICIPYALMTRTETCLLSFIGKTNMQTIRENCQEITGRENNQGKEDD
jgi:hypothetical protein